MAFSYTVKNRICIFICVSTKGGAFLRVLSTRCFPSMGLEICSIFQVGTGNNLIIHFFHKNKRDNPQLYSGTYVGPLIPSDPTDLLPLLFQTCPMPRGLRLQSNSIEHLSNRRKCRLRLKESCCPAGSKQIRSANIEPALRMKQTGTDILAIRE